MRKRWVTPGLLALLVLWATPSPVPAGDSIYGKVVGVLGPDLVVFSYGPGRYTVRLIGIVFNKNSLRARATDDLKRLVGQPARVRFESLENGVMVGRLLTDHPIKDVGLELVSRGLAQPRPGYDFKYGRALLAAAAKAQTSHVGMYSIPPPAD